MKTTWEFEAKDEASKAIERISKSLKKTDDRFEKTSKSASKFSKVGGKLKGGMKGLATGARGLGTAFASMGATAVVGIGLVTGAMLKAIEASEEQDKVNRSLADTYERLGGSVEDYNRAQERAAQVSEQTGIGDEDILQGMEKYARLTGDIALSTEDLSTITGIAAKNDLSMADAATKLANAQRGKTEGLEDLLPLTKDQADALNGLKDSSKRASIATSLLREQYEGFAEEIEPTALAMKRLENAAGDLVQQFGHVITQSGLIPALLDPITDALRSQEKAVGDNSVEWQQFILGTGASVVKGLVLLARTASENAVAISGVVSVVKSLGLGLGILQDTVETITAGMIGLAAKGIGSLVESTAKFLDLSADLAIVMGPEARARFKEYAAGARETAASLEAIGEKGFDVSADAGERAAAKFDAIMATMGDTGANADALRERLDLLAQTGDKMGENLRKAMGEVKPLEGPNLKSRGGADLGDLNNEKAKKNAETAKKAFEAALKRAQQETAAAHQMAMRGELARKELAILKEGDEIKRLTLEKEASLFQIANDRSLLESERVTQIYAAELSHKEAIEELEKRRLERVESENQTLLDDLSSSMDSQIAKRFEQTQSQLLNAADIYRDALSGLDGDSTFEKTSRSLGGLSASLMDVTANAQKLGKDGAKSSEIFAGAMGGLGPAVSDAASEFGASRQEMALIEGAFMAAQSVAFGAMGNVPGAIAAGTAAAMHGAIAAGAIGSGGASAASSTPSGPSQNISGGGSNKRNVDQDQRRLASYIGDELSRGNDGQMINVSFNFSGPSMQTPEFEELITNAARRGFDAQGIRLGR